MQRTHRSSCCHPSSLEGPRHRTSRARPRAGLHRLRESLMTSSTSFLVGAGRWALGAGRQSAFPIRDLFVGFCAQPRPSVETPPAPSAQRHPSISVQTHTLSPRAIFVKTNMATQRMRKAQAARLGTLEQLFKAMADQTRLRILALLAGGEVCVCDIHETLGIPQPRASRHLAYLRRTGLVLDRKEGLWVYYRL